MTLTSAIDGNTQPRTLHDYIDMVLTPECFVPKHILRWQAPKSQAIRQPSTCSTAPMLSAHRHLDTSQQSTTPQCSASPYISIATDFPHPSLDKVLPAYLDHPLDNFQIHGPPSMAPRYWEQWTPLAMLEASRTLPTAPPDIAPTPAAPYPSVSTTSPVASTTALVATPLPPQHRPTPKATPPDQLPALPTIQLKPTTSCSFMLALHQLATNNYCPP